MPTSADILRLARLFVFVREARDRTGHATNRGRWVEAIQRVSSVAPGSPWCAAFVSLVLELAFMGKSPLPITASCDELLEAARAKGWLTDTPSPGDIGLVLVTPTDADHAFFVSEDVSAERVGSLGGNEGDPDAPPTREGYGVFERPVAKGRRRSPSITYIHYPRAA